jgi:Cu-processing system ATP-binding protein
MIRLKSLLEKKKEQKKTIIVTTHIINIVEEIADELVFLLEGKVYYKGSVSGLMKMQDEYDLENAIANILIKNNAESIKV